MIDTIGSYVRRGKHIMRKWSLDPGMHALFRIIAHALAGFGLSAASLSNAAQPLALGLVCACTGFEAITVALGGAAGYLFFWSNAGQQGVLWLVCGLAASVLLGDRRITRSTPLLLPAVAGLIVSTCGVVFQTWMQDTTPIWIFLVRVAAGGASTALFCRVLHTRNPILEWITCGVAVLALSQIALTRWLNLGYIVAGIVCATGAFPAVALTGLALDLAQITPISMTAIFCGSFLIRFFPRYPALIGDLAPALLLMPIMLLCGKWDILPLPALLLGGMLGHFLPAPHKAVHRRGETGAAQVQLELASGVLAQTEQLLLESPIVPIDEDALVTRAAGQACSGCPCRKGCKDSQRIAQLSAVLLHKPLLTPDELPIVCRKSGRFLAELHRSQEQLRSIRADRERQREYRAAVLQQFRFLSEFLQDLSDRLSRKAENLTIHYEPQVHVYSNRPEADNGDRCAMFAGTAGHYYVLLCDGMGTGLGAVQEGKTAASMLRRLLCAGYPAEHALRSLNSLCALRDRAGAVTVDLVELQLDTGKATVYKWGAAASYIISGGWADKIGTAGPPPGLSVTDYRETAEHLSLRRGELLVLVSDGIGEEEALHCCLNMAQSNPQDLAESLLSCSRLCGEDDATVALIRLHPV